MRRVVVTGVGLESPLGSDPLGVFDAVLEGRSGVVRMASWTEMDELQSLIAAPVTGFDERSLPRKFRRTMGRVAQLAVSAAVKATERAGLTADALGRGRTAVVAGSTVGSPAAEAEFWDQLLTRRTARGTKSTLFFQGMSHTCAANIALMLGITGEVLSTNAACASSTQAIGVAVDRIRSGRADVAIAGGAEELHVASAVVFQGLSAISTGSNDAPEVASRPFDRRRDGIVVGEGAGIVVLEARDHALARGAPILGEVLGFGTTCDARHMANPDAAAMIAAIRACLADAGGVGEGIDYVNAHATGTVAGDAAEARALLEVVGERVPVSSTKGHLGHLLGACGAIEAIVTLEAMRRGIAPHTRNLVEPDVAPIHLLRAPLEARLDRCLSTNFAFGGVNAVLLLGSEATARS